MKCFPTYSEPKAGGNHILDTKRNGSSPPLRINKVKLSLKLGI